MRVEDYWTDCSVYLVSFCVIIEEKERKIDKILVLKQELSEKEVEPIIMERFIV